MAMVSGARRRGLEEEVGDEGEERLDRISRLPDGVLGDIVSLLPTKAAARTQVLSSRWRHIWRTAPLNIDIVPYRADQMPDTMISPVLSAHQGPVRRFSVPENYLRHRRFPATNLDGWLESPTLDGLQELKFHYGLPCRWDFEPPSLPASVNRFSPTLRVASFGGCCFPDVNDAGRLQFPVLKQLSLSDVSISESSLRVLLAACPDLQSLLLIGSIGCSRVQIVCPTLRSIGVRTTSSDYEAIELEQLIIEDAPSLETLLCFDYGNGITILVMSAPKLYVLGSLSDNIPRFEFGTTVFQGSSSVSLKTVVHSVKILSLTLDHPSLDVVIGLMKCFPCLEKLYIKIRLPDEKNFPQGYKYKDLIGNLDIRLRKIVLEGYGGNKSHANFAKFFVLNAPMLESMRLQVIGAVHNRQWIDKQHRLLEIKNKASRDMQLDFAPGFDPPLFSICPEQVHDLSTTDPFS